MQWLPKRTGRVPAYQIRGMPGPAWAWSCCLSSSSLLEGSHTSRMVMLAHFFALFIPHLSSNIALIHEPLRAQSVDQLSSFCRLPGCARVFMFASWVGKGGHALCGTLQRNVRGLLQSSVPPDCPLIGEIPAVRVLTGERFWLDTDQRTVPKEYRHDECPTHYQSLPILFAAFRSSLPLPPVGTWASRKLRNSGLTPALLDSLPCKQPPVRLVMPTAQVSTAFRQFGASFTNAMFLLQILPLDELGVFNQPEAEALDLAERGWRPRVLHTFQVGLPAAH
jgi:hypothetical protein